MIGDRRTALPWLVFGRVARPWHLTVAIGTAVLAWQYLGPDEGVPGGSSAWSELVGLAAALTSAVMVVAWWGRAERLAVLGLLLAAGVWVARTTLWGMTLGWVTPSVGFGLAWVVGIVGSYLLEVTTPPRAAAKGAGDE